MNKCVNIKSCTWWWCKTYSECLLYEHKRRKLMILSLKPSIGKRTRKRVEKAEQGIQRAYKTYKIPIKEWKVKIINRDKCCQLCGATEYLTVDHIKPKSKGGMNEDDNLQALCIRCNCKKYKPKYKS